MILVDDLCILFFLQARYSYKFNAELLRGLWRLLEVLQRLVYKNTIVLVRQKKKKDIDLIPSRSNAEVLSCALQLILVF